MDATKSDGGRLTASKQRLADMEPWRRTVNIALLVLAVVVLALVVTSTLSGPMAFGALALVIVGSVCVGPRSPFFRSQPA